MENAIFTRSGMEDFTEAERNFIGGGLTFELLFATKKAGWRSFILF